MSDRDMPAKTAHLAATFQAGDVIVGLRRMRPERSGPPRSSQSVGGSLSEKRPVTVAKRPVGASETPTARDAEHRVAWRAFFEIASGTFQTELLNVSDRCRAERRKGALEAPE